MKVYTRENLANALMKVLPQHNFYKCMALMRLIDRMEFAEALEHQGEDCRTWCGAPKAQRIKKKAKVQSV